jgi:hypothetical protein
MAEALIVQNAQPSFPAPSVEKFNPAPKQHSSRRTNSSLKGLISIKFVHRIDAIVKELRHEIESRDDDHRDQEWRQNLLRERLHPKTQSVLRQSPSRLEPIGPKQVAQG